MSEIEDANVVHTDTESENEHESEHESEQEIDEVRFIRTTPTGCVSREYDCRFNTKMKYHF